MNKEVIKKYWKEFEHWVNGKDVLVRFQSSDSTPTYEYKKAHKHTRWDNHWHTEGREVAYVINDEYVSYRKAIAEGKTIERNAFSDPMWLKHTGEFTYPVKNYRIKPDECEFKIGKYVVCRHGIAICSNVFKEDNKLYFDAFRCYQDMDKCRLWTLEEANDDEWIYVQWDCSTRLEVYQVEELRNEMLDEHCVSKVVRTIPMIGQTPEQLGLEK